MPPHVRRAGTRGRSNTPPHAAQARAGLSAGRSAPRTQGKFAAFDEFCKRLHCIGFCKSNVVAKTRPKLAAFERCYISDQFPDLLIAEHAPPRHGGSGHTVSNGEKYPARIRRIGPWRQCEVCRRRVHPGSPLTSAVAAGAVTDG